MLLGGATWEQLETARGGVAEHIRHLRDEHGLTVVDRDGTFSLELLAEG